jgi:uncharacterized integral membrane protein
MSKVKLVILIILGIVLVDFALENSLPSPMLKLFKYELGEIPTYLLTYSSLAVGLVIGWTAHGFRIRRKRREVQAAQAASAQQQSDDTQTRQAETQAQ